MVIADRASSHGGEKVAGMGCVLEMQLRGLADGWVACEGCQEKVGHG